MAFSVEAFRRRFHPDFEEDPDNEGLQKGDDRYNYAVPTYVIERAASVAQREFAIDDDEALDYLVAHKVCTDGADSASVDHGAGIVSTYSGDPGIVVKLPGGDVDLERTKYGRTHKRLVAALMGGPGC